MPFDLIAFDADDTLWVNEPLYREAEQELERMLAPFLSETTLTRRLYEQERKNLDLFGYGAKSFMLSMIETAIELSGGRITGAEIQRIIDTGKAMLRKPVRLLPHVAPTLRRLSERHRLMVLTKGDLFDQESKLARSGLAPYFAHVEIVSEKNPSVYRRILDRHGVAPERFLMVGNSLKSDVLPVIETGGRAVHIPYHTTWIHEHVDDVTPYRDAFTTLEHIGEVPGFLDRMRAALR
ncbi:HAD family hydrolase [Rhodocaloribacter sp.]